jgi:phosphoglycerate dehydrogenase-like enzyme
VLGQAHSVEWIQSLWAGVGTIINAMHQVKARRKAEMERLAKLAEEREAKLAAIRESRSEVMAKMKEANQILADANEKLKSISKRRITELSHYSKPPTLVKLCLTATCDLLGFGEDLEYKALKKVLVKENFPRKMANFDPVTVTQEQLDRLDATYLSLPEFTVEHMTRASVVCGVLTDWLLSLRMVCKVCQDTGVQELRKELAALQTVNFGGNDVALGDLSTVNGLMGGVLALDFTLTKLGDCFGDVIAEYCLMQILNWNRKAHDMRAWQTDKKWRGQAPSAPKQVMKFKRMKDHVVGILGGSGNIGLAIGDLLHGVGCQVHALASKARADLPKNHLKWFAAGSGELLPFLRSGITVLINVLPSTLDTTGFLSHELLENAYGGAQSACSPPLFINVGRGDVISTPDLIAALEQGLFSGAALDVFEEEPLPIDSPLWACAVGESKNSVIITPHIAATSASVLPEIVALCRKNLLAFSKKQQLSFVVNVARGY